ncbi:cilia- and flagella-associated protein 206 isoform X2 [Protopterus annectens]|nr:cilia- and flagella-associated protein 206 isoform X2 [Protopterus annectens]XP_043925180.1 cilia- and flagella-associated protein 206 isoform X2 [Protopterus annectens]XP_043925189.1 cilia- and flagella-associated protein 206 isoform X2 [Protopterus annectens]XP_043925198.1 cilia- and flagella-associated protein 206 isoform X2 [Protopterus annectens]
MSRVQAESVIKNIIREIGQECSSKGHTVSETLVAFVVKAVVLDPRNEFNVERTLTKSDVQKLIKLCVDRLLDVKSPSLDTIKMQVYFDMNYTSRDEFLHEHHRVLESRLAPVSREITDSRSRTREELESLYRKIVSYVLLSSGLGSPTDISIVREATAALQSVFPQAELGTFLSLNKKDKERQLNELTMIVTGIRLFNKDGGKGGEGIDDLPAILNEAIPATSKHIEAELQQCQQLIYSYTALIEQLEEKHHLTKVPETMWFEALYNVRQHEVFLHVILSDVIYCAKQVEMLENQLASQMEQLRTTVRAKTAVPTALVYPHFIALSNIWTGLQNEMVLLSVLSNLATNLLPFLGTHAELFPAEAMQPLLDQLNVKTDEQRLQETLGQRVNIADFKKQDWLFPETTANFDKLPLQYRGFCGFTIAKKHGLLLPGNPDIGILKHKEKYYIFSSREAAYAFAQQPEEYLLTIAEKAKQHAELIQLLELHQQFAAVTPYSQAKTNEALMIKPITKCDSSTQTDTHLVESNIVKSYEWNEWELRRKAIKLANLRQKATHSMQTNLSHMRRDNTSQVYLPKQVGTQTKRDSASNVPKPQIYLAGLRGGMSKTTHMVKINLTRDVDES